MICEEAVMSLACSEDSDLIAAGLRSGTISVCNPIHHRPSRSFASQLCWFTGLARAHRQKGGRVCESALGIRGVRPVFERRRPNPERRL